MGDGDRGRPEVAGIAESSGVLDAVTALDPAVRAGEAAAAAAAVAAERTVPPAPLAAGPDRGRVLRRRQHDDAGRVDLPLRPRPGRPRTSSPPATCSASSGSRSSSGIGGEDARRHVHAPGRGALSFVAGRPVAEIVELGEEIYDELMADRIWPGTRALAQHAPRRRAAGLAGDGDAGGAGADHRPPAGPDRRARHRRRERGRRLHRPAGRRAAARPGQGRTRCASLAAREGLDLRRCTAYSRLGATTSRCCRWSAPRWRSTRTATLRDVARERGWQIRDFRTGPQGRQDRRRRRCARRRGAGRRRRAGRPARSGARGRSLR